MKDRLILMAEFIRFGLFTFGGGWSIIAQMQQLYVDIPQEAAAATFPAP